MAAQSFVLPPVHVTRGDAAGRARARAAPAVGHRSQRRPGPLLPRRPGRARDSARGRRRCTSTARRSTRARCSTWSRTRSGSTRTTSSSSAGAWAAGSAARKRRCRCSRASPRSLARRTGRAVKLRLDRDDDMRSTGKRHAFAHGYDVGFDDEGRILALDLTLASRCGFSADLSGPVNDRAVFHADNAYWLPDVAIHSYPLQDATRCPTPRSAASAGRRACSRSRRSSTRSRARSAATRSTCARRTSTARPSATSRRSA